MKILVVGKNFRPHQIDIIHALKTQGAEILHVDDVDEKVAGFEYDLCLWDEIVNPVEEVEDKPEKPWWHGRAWYRKFERRGRF